MSKLLLLVIATLLSLSYSQIDSSVGRCDALTASGEKECITSSSANTISCVWCASLKKCRAKSLGCECKDCPLEIRPDGVCDDANKTPLPVTCNRTSCQWEKGECPEPPKNCLACPQLDANRPGVVCSDGTVVVPKCDYSTCTNLYPACPDCLNCANVPKPESFTTVICPDGTTAGTVCDQKSCTWTLGQCGNVPVACDAAIFNCLLSPCREKNNPEAVTCTENYCGGCFATCFDKAGNKVSCTVGDVVPSLDCSDETNCPADTKPAIKCANGGSVYCGRVATDGTKLGYKCDWQSFCPSDPPVQCGVDSCPNTISSDALTACPDGQKPYTKCLPTDLRTTSTDTKTAAGEAISVVDCTNKVICPLPIVDPVAPRCVLGGVCGDVCMEANSDVATGAEATSAVACRASEDNCEAKCSFNYKTGCNYVAGVGCSLSRGPGFDECVKQCKGITVDPVAPVCGGGLCDCDMDNCYFCQQYFTSDADSTQKVFGVCIENKYGDACKAVRGESLLDKPARCSILPPVVIPPVLKDTVQKLKDTTRESVQAEFDKRIDSIPELKDLLISVKNSPTSPEIKNDDSFNTDLLIEVAGGVPTVSQQTSICEKLVKPVAAELTKADIKACDIQKLTASSSDTTAKRGIQQTGSNTYLATVNGGASTPSNPPGTNNPSAAVTTLVSVVAIIFTIVALMF